MYCTHDAMHVQALRLPQHRPSHLAVTLINPATLRRPPSTTPTRKLYIKQITNATATHQEPVTHPDSNPDTVRYFAFGSNMATSVLNGRRQCTPLAAAPAIAPGYTLAFNIRGFPYRCALRLCKPVLCHTPCLSQGACLCLCHANTR